MFRRGKQWGERTRNLCTKEFKFKLAIAATKGEKPLPDSSGNGSLPILGP